MRVAYGESNVLRCSIQLAYDRFFAEFNYNDTHGAVTEDAFSMLTSQEQARRNGLLASMLPKENQNIDEKAYVSPYERKHGKK